MGELVWPLSLTSFETSVIFSSFSHITESNVTWHAPIHVAINKSWLLHMKKFNIRVHKYYTKFEPPDVLFE
jgi:hypothetical protein